MCHKELDAHGAEIALTLTHLDAELTGILLTATLQQALAYALAQHVP